MPEALKDRFTNMIQVQPEESTVNTLTFGDIDLGLTIFQKVGIIVNRIVIDWTAQLLGQFNNDNDRCLVSITQSDNITSIGLHENAVIFKAERMRIDFGTAASAQLADTVIAYDLMGLPGGGELMAPRPLHWAIQGSGLDTAASVTMRIYFQILELKADEYFEILEARRFFG